MVLPFCKFFVRKNYDNVIYLMHFTEILKGERRWVKSKNHEFFSKVCILNFHVYHTKILPLKEKKICRKKVGELGCYR